jgi:hypothetical protein
VSHQANSSSWFYLTVAGICEAGVSRVLLA